MKTRTILSVLMGVLLLFLGVYLALDFLKVFFKFAIGLVLIMIGLYLLARR